MSILRVVHDTFGERTARVGEVKANIKKIVSWMSWTPSPCPPEQAGRVGQGMSWS